MYPWPANCATIRRVSNESGFVESEKALDGTSFFRNTVPCWYEMIGRFEVVRCLGIAIKPVALIGLLLSSGIIES